MRRFCYQLFLFMVPFMVGIILLFMLPYDKQFGYQRMEYDCRNGHWLYNRIYEHPLPIDIALFGSSRMMCAISDYWLEQWISPSSDSMHYVANLGFCRYGRNLHYSLAKDLFKYHAPSHLIIEVRELEGLASHIDFPHIADSRDVLIPPTFPKDNYFPDMIQALRTRWQYHRHLLLNLPATPDTVDPLLRHSFIPSGNHRKSPEIKASPALRSVRSIQETDLPYRMSRRLSFACLEEIASLVERHRSRLIFLYIPRYHSPPAQLPVSLASYEALGEVWMLPDSIWHNPEYWGDPVHLNDFGAMATTKWMAGKLNQAH